MKISMMTSVGDLEDSIFLHESVICGHHIFKDVHALNKPCSRTGRKYALNKEYALNNQVHLITRVYGIIAVHPLPSSKTSRAVII